MIKPELAKQFLEQNYDDSFQLNLKRQGGLTDPLNLLDVPIFHDEVGMTIAELIIDQVLGDLKLMGNSEIEDLIENSTSAENFLYQYFGEDYND